MSCESWLIALLAGLILLIVLVVMPKDWAVRWAPRLLCTRCGWHRCAGEYGHDLSLSIGSLACCPNCGARVETLFMRPLWGKSFIVAIMRYREGVWEQREEEPDED